MKKNDLMDLKTKTVDELRKHLVDLREDLIKIKSDTLANESKNTNALRNKRHEIARVLTFITMKEKMSREAGSRSAGERN